MIETWLKNPTPEALARKTRNEKKLLALGVPVSPTLPALGKGKLRTQKEILERLFALTVAASKGDGLEQSKVDKLLAQLQAAPFLSPEERAFVKDPKPSEAELTKFGWRFWGVLVLLWSVGSVDSLERPKDPSISKLVTKDNGAALKKAAKLRSLDEILEAADLLYREDWACEDARLNGTPAPSALDCDVVFEQHWALNWLISYLGQAWDDVSTDT